MSMYEWVTYSWKGGGYYHDYSCVHRDYQGGCEALELKKWEERNRETTLLVFNNI